MANYTTREQNRAELILGLEAGLRPPKFPMPTCACGAPAKWSHLKSGNSYYCNTHLPPDMRETIVNSPLYAGRDPYRS
jgi:hypothetical protein